MLLHHGLSAGAGSFDIGVGTTGAPVPSIAHWLADQGYDVWACDLRGRGESGKPASLGKPSRSVPFDWSVDDYIEKDNPAIVDYILEKTGFRQLHWIGHSMGGILLYCHTALHGSPKLASGVAVGSGLEYLETGSGYETLIPYAGIIKKIRRVPLGKASRLFAYLCGRRHTRLEQFQAWPPNAAPAVLRAIFGGVIHDVSSRVLLQLATMFEPGGLRSMDGKTIYSDLVGNITTPLLLLAGERDLQSSPKLVEKTFALLDNPKKHGMEVFGKPHGHADDYGHFDLLCGLRAEKEVYPHILEWLKKHPAKKTARKKK